MMKRQITEEHETNWLASLSIDVIMNHIVGVDLLVFGRLLVVSKSLAAAVVAWNEGDVFYQMVKSNWPERFCCLYELLIEPELYTVPLAFFKCREQQLLSRFGYSKKALSLLLRENQCSVYTLLTSNLVSHCLPLPSVSAFLCDSTRRRAEKDPALASSLADYWISLHDFAIPPAVVYREWVHDRRRQMVAALKRLRDIEKELTRGQICGCTNEISRLYEAERDFLATVCRDTTEYQTPYFHLLMFEFRKGVTDELPESTVSRLTRDLIIAAWEKHVAPVLPRQPDWFEEPIRFWLPQDSQACLEEADRRDQRFVDTIDDVRFKLVLEGRLTTGCVIEERVGLRKDVWKNVNKAITHLDEAASALSLWLTIDRESGSMRYNHVALLKQTCELLTPFYDDIREESYAIAPMIPAETAVSRFFRLLFYQCVQQQQ